MADLTMGEATCTFCSTVGVGFELDSAICSLTDEMKQQSYGCAACLSEGKFEFWHDTDIGFLDENGLSKVYKHNGIPPFNFPPQAMIELRRTPQILTWQQEVWLSHCNDFMAYVGTWEPADFQKYASGGSPRDLFLSMTRDPELQFLWDECLEPGELVPGWWNVTYYVFRCLHCGKLAGNWDCD